MSNSNGIHDDLDSTVLENARELANFMDIEYAIDLRIGHAELTVRELLRLRIGDRIRLNRRTSENVLLMIENNVIAEAEVYPTKSGSGVRIIDILQ